MGLTRTQQAWLLEKLIYLVIGIVCGGVIIGSTYLKREYDKSVIRDAIRESRQETGK